MDPAEKEALMAELSAMKPLALAKRAGEIGVNEKKIEEADEAEDRKTAFIALIEQHLAQPPPTMRALVNRREGESLLYSVEEVPTPTVMGEKDLICKIEASPINPSDLGKLGLTARLGGDSVSALEGGGGGVTCKLPADAPLPDDFNQQCGNEAAAIVVAAGAHPEAQRLMGKRVAIKTGQCYAQYAKTTVDEPYFAALPEGMSAEEGASVYVNPLTVIGFVDTMRAEGHTALVHTAAGSQLGRMLVKHCKTEGVELVNIVRSEAAAAALSEIGAEHIVSSASPTYKEDLIAACKATGATLGFDATGGGTLAAEIITAMEAALKLNGTAAHPAYGTATLKQVYRYGGLQKGPTELPMSLGMAWGVGGWLMPFHFDKRGPDHLRASIDHAVAGLTTTFATSYGKRLSLDEMAADVESYLATLASRTGEKFLVCPNGLPAAEEGVPPQEPEPQPEEAWSVTKGAIAKTADGTLGAVTTDPDSDGEVKLGFADGEDSGYIKADSLTQATPSDAGYEALLPVALGLQLWDAAEAGDAAAIERLAGEGASPDATDRYAGDPAVVAAAWRRHTAAVEALLRLGADPEATAPGGETALMMAARNGHADATAALLDGGAATNTVNIHGGTALMGAADRGHAECARLLLEAGADASLRATGGGWEGKTALEVAEERGKAEVVALLRD